MDSTSRSQLGNSWVQGDMNDDSISWAEGSEGEDEDESTKTQFPQPRSNDTKRSERQKYSQSTASDFVMPSMGGTSYQRKQPQQSFRANPQSIPSRQSQPYTASIRSSQNRTRKHQHVDDTPSYLMDAVHFILDLLGSSLRNLKTPISWVISIYLLFGLVMFLRNLLFSSISNALSPICRLPGVAFLDLPICSYTSRIPNSPTIQPSVASQVDPEFGALMEIHSKFDSLLSDTTSTTALSLPFDMKIFQGSIRDLRGVVRNSKLPLKGELLQEFEELVKIIGEASWDLGRFNIHVVGATDLVVVTARFAEDALNDIATKKADRGLIPAFIQDTILAPFQPIPFTEEKVLDQYIRHAHGISEQIERLLEEARAILLKISRIEEILDDIHDVSQRANVVVESDRDEILGDLWTVMGGNKDKVSRVAQKMALLKSMAGYRKVAFSHVAGAIVKLQGMAAELEELNARMNEPEVERNRGAGGVPLTVHIETIRMGIDRLRAQSRHASKIQDDYVQGRLDGIQRDREEKGWLVADARQLD